MKKIFLAFISLSLLFLAQSCDKDLPYPIDEVKKGVLIDVARIPGTDGVLSDGLTTGNYKVKLTIPENQGDYSFMKNAQLLAVLTDTDGERTSQVVIDEITQFPQEITLNIADIYSKFGYTAPVVGQVLNLTTNVVLKDGSVIPGWTELTGFNNVAFSGWMVDGRAYSSNVRYAVVCALDLNDFAGTCWVTLDEWWGEEPYPVEVTKVSDTQLSIEGLFDGEAENPLVITVDLDDYSLSFPRQVLTPDSHLWWGRPPGDYSNFGLEGSGVVDACNLQITFTTNALVSIGSGLGGWSNISFAIEKNP